MHTRRRAFTPSPGKQRGQALLFVTVTALVMLLAMLTMFSMGQLTTEKMKLQNTADAAAYSAAIAQARDYNFSAYLNRGMIANDVAVAQLVGLASWGRNYYDTFNTLTTRVDTRYEGLVNPGPLYPMWSIPEGLAKTASVVLKPAFDDAARLFVPLLLTINEAFASSQKIYHFGTALTVAQTLGVDDKFNDIMKGAAGFDLSMITEFIRWGSCPTSTDADDVDTSNCYNVVKLNDRSAHLSLLGMAGYADNTTQWLNFTSERNPLGPWGTETRVDAASCRPGEMSFGPGFSDSWPEGVCFDLFGRDGHPPHPPEQVTTTQTHPEDLKTDDGLHKDRMAGVVTASLDDFTTDRSKTWLLPMLVDPILVAGPEAYVPSAWFLKKLYHDGATKLADDKDANGWRKADSWNQRWVGQDSTSMLAISTVPVGPIPFWGFLNIPAVPWWSGSGTLDLLGADASGTASAGPDSGDLEPKKTALRKYRDVADVEQASPTKHQNISSPALLVEVEKRTNTIATSASGHLRIGRSGGATDPAGCSIGDAARNAPQVTAPFGSGNLDVGDGAAANCMRALSKAEAYFSRPADLFPRKDGLTEYGSLYSPYWQARLLPNNADEQSASLFLHGLTDFKSFAAGVPELIK